MVKGDRGDRSGKENEDRQLCHGACIWKPQVQFSPQLFSKSHIKESDEQGSEDEKGMLNMFIIGA